MENPPSVSIRTFGCKLNQYESMGMLEQLEKSGLRVVPPDQKSDIVIINTCTVTQRTDQRTLKLVRALARQQPDSRILIIGCSAQRQKNEFLKLFNVRAVLGNREKNHIAEYVQRVWKEEPVIVAVSDLQKAPFERLSISRFRNYTRAFIKIQEGCDRYCSYCVIPTVRGPSRSQAPDLVVQDIQNLANHNYREIVLTGIDLGVYGLDLTPATNLASLLTEIEKIPEIARIRLSSIEPMDFDRELIEKITISSKICRHFHIPLQSATDRILKMMSRSYTHEDYASIIEAIKTASPDACIGADLITGFPGETESEFEEGYRFVENLPIDYLHVFSYSDRTGRPSTHFPDKVPFETIKARCQTLRDLGYRKAISFRKRMIGKQLSAIVLGVVDKATGLPQGLTDNYIRVTLPNHRIPKGAITNVVLDKVDGLICSCRVLDQ